MSQSVESVHGYTIQGTYPRAGDKSTTSTLREVISSSCFHASSSGAEPQETQSATHILLQTLFTRANFLQFWPLTAKFTGMAEQTWTPTPNPSVRLYDAPIPTQHKSNHSQQYTLEPGMSQALDSEHGYLILGTYPPAGV